MARRTHVPALIGRFILAAAAIASSVVTAAAGSVTLAWDPNAESDLAGYVVSWGTQPGVYTSSSDVRQLVTFTVPNLTAGQRYYFAVQAYNTSGLTSPYSAEVSAQVPSAPQAPTVQSVSPDHGPAAGGTAISLTGTGFTSGMAVTIGGVPATAVTVLSATSITAVTGAHALGAADVVVSAAGQTAATLASGFSFGDEGDADGDGLPDAWERRYGLDPDSAAGDDGATGDPDQDGVANEQEYRTGTHPRGFFKRYFAEGISSTFFTTVLAVANPNDTAVEVVMQFFKTDGTTAVDPVTVGARSRATLDARSLESIADAAFSTSIESDQLVVADRTVSWDATGYGGHAETAVEAPSTTWYLAEGATHSSFDLFYLLQNPTATDAEVEVRYLLPQGAPIVKTYQVAANSRYNIWVDLESPALRNTDVSAVITSTNGVPIIVERSMYQSANGQPFGAGHNSAGVTAPSTNWFLAEGATGSFFDMFVLIANPTDEAATVKATYLLPSGSTVEKSYLVAANSRFNIWVDYDDERLANTSLSTTIESTNGVPIIVERTMWWGASAGQGWVEAHNAFGTVATASRWALAEGEAGGGQHRATYVLMANTSSYDGDVRMTLLFEDGNNVSRVFRVTARSRFSVDVASAFPAAVDKRFGAVIEGLGANPVQMVVERAMYWDADGEFWAAGTDAVGTPLGDPASAAATTAWN